ncbi:claudin domain-containing protein 2-like isoform X1 [Hemicordylus capensis]|uniref:claudin domain-containing protein 2-like isoform X1 n=1 Tax=Hemicordylus capensis TaxID=884348 RepID=UPI0023039A1F|nr:claudin domain-containing protein 2-like isoform X1 [Hemicordylus capensis]
MAYRPSPVKDSLLRRFLADISRWDPLIWLTNLNEIGRLRLWGVFSSCSASCMSVTALSTEYWSKQFVRGIFIHRGLWKDCKLGKCTYHRNVQSYIAFTIVFMLVSNLTCYVSVICGTLDLKSYKPPIPKEKMWPLLTVSQCIIAGCTGAIGLFIFMSTTTLKPNTFLSWSLIPGWLSVIFISTAGVLHFVASRWEQDLANESPTVTVLYKLKEKPSCLDLTTELTPQRQMATSAV